MSSSVLVQCTLESYWIQWLVRAKLWALSHRPKAQTRPEAGSDRKGGEWARPEVTQSCTDIVQWKINWPQTWLVRFLSSGDCCKSLYVPFWFDVALKNEGTANRHETNSCFCFVLFPRTSISSAMKWHWSTWTLGNRWPSLVPRGT